jgi:CRISPR/Cas system CSM-associated protein Csm3 (group 7 of RAMP superfamily)
MDTSEIETIKVNTNDFKMRRFKYKYHLIMCDTEGTETVNKKFCTAQAVVDDFPVLFRNRQVINRIVANYAFSKNFHKYDHVTIHKINEVRKFRFKYYKVLDE